MDVSATKLALLHVPIDWIILGVLVVLITLDAIRSGSNRAVSIALALPAAFFLFNELSQSLLLGGMVNKLSSPIAQGIVFLGLVVVFYFIIHRILGFYGISSGAPLQALIAGIATTILIAVVWVQALWLQPLWHFGPQVQAIFAEGYRFWWVMGAYVALAAVRS
jgi:hypothetical protein